MGIPVAAGTDATRVASYNPWVCLHWLVTGKTVGGMALYPDASLLSREQALRLYTQGGTWFSSEEGQKGTLQVGQFADLAVLSDDFFSVTTDRIKQIESVLTVVDGKIVYATGPLAPLSPPDLPVSPDWSPVGAYGGYGGRPLPLHRQAMEPAASLVRDQPCDYLHRMESMLSPPRQPRLGSDLWGAEGCGCWAF
jgi:Amidohydrolase family